MNKENNKLNKFEAKIWKKIDIPIKSSKTYDNPYCDLDIEVIFTKNDTKITLNAFWNGENNWIVRFTPTLLGIWNYKIICSDRSNNINNITGEIIVTENDNITNVDKHGFIKISKNKRYFVYSDETPFFWLGDTNWQSFNLNNYYECNYPKCNCKNQFRHILNNRKSKNFNVYQTYFDTSNGYIQNDENMWTEKYNKINPRVFTNTIDKMFEDIVNSDMIIALGFGLHYVTPNQMTKEELNRFVKYIVARYSAYPIVWITGQEIDLEEKTNTYEIWKSVAKTVKENDPYHHPITGHMYSHPKRIEDLNNQKWHSFWAIQSGHYGMSKIATKKNYKLFYDLKPIKPILETEANYEDIKCSNRFNGYDASRISAWKAVLCGSPGFTYGGNGIWASCYNTTDKTFCLGDYSTEPWYMGLDKPGSFEMTYVRKFFELIHFEKLIPNFDEKKEDTVISSTKDKDIVVIYFYKETYESGKLKNLQNKLYYSYWYNPLTGNFIKNMSFKPINGEYNAPNKPTKGDWIFFVSTNKYDITDFEDIYIDKKINIDEIKKIGIDAYLSKKTKIKDYNIFCVSNEDELCDFKNIKYNPYCDITTKTIEIDFQNIQCINLIKIDYKDEKIPDFMIYGIDKNNKCIVISDCKYRNPNIINDSIIEKISGEYKKIKIIILNNNEKLKIKKIDLYK